MFLSPELVNEYFSSCNKIIESCYESGIALVEIYFRVLNRNREMFDKGNNNQVDIFNAFMSGYEKAKMDILGFTNKEKLKEPSDIYF